MSMVTSCPACTTTFRVSPEQLSQRQGKVRCGKCSGVFDAFKSLATLPDEPTVELPAEPPAAAVAGGSASAMPQQGTLDIGPSEIRVEGAVADVRAPAKARLARVLGFSVLAVLALLLAAQLAYAFRDRLAASWPATRPLLERMCALTGCTVAWPKRPDLLAIEASDLQADPIRANVIVLTATLRNRGSIGVARPALELTLTDSQDQMIARRIFLPRDYLPGAADASSAMPPLTEVDVRLTLDTADLRPAGYRLFLFYP
jgi:predicted Zn finger-like uncharacterized protein